jgi:hypothetical protein
MTTTLDVIKAELQRQHDEWPFPDHTDCRPRVDDPEIDGNVVIQGCIDLQALAAAIDKAREEEEDAEDSAALEAARAAIRDEHGPKVRLVPRLRRPGLPTNTGVTAIGYDKDGRPWIMDWFEGNDGSDGTEALSARWEACGPYMRSQADTRVTADGVVDCHEHPDFIVEHEIVEVKK